MKRLLLALACVFLFAGRASAQTPVVVLQDIYEAIAASAAQDVNHGAADSGNPVKIGCKAVAFGSNPTGVDAADRSNIYCNRAGVMFVIGGHPNTITETATVTDSDGAQTGTAIVSVSTGTKIAIVAYGVKCSNANTVNVDFLLAFDTDATLASASTTGVVGHIDGMDDIPAGGGFTVGDGAGILGVGADDEDLRYSLSDPTTGSCTVTVKYFIIES